MQSSAHELVRQAAWALVGGQRVYGLELAQALMAVLRERTWMIHQLDRQAREVARLRLALERLRETGRDDLEAGGRGEVDDLLTEETPQPGAAWQAAVDGLYDLNRRQN